MPKEVTVKGSSALNCETKIVREYLRVSCRGKNDSGGTPTAVKVTRGGRGEVFTFASPGVTSLIVPFVSGVEFFGGILLLLGLMTRISAGALGIVMIVAVKSAQWEDVDSLQTLLGLEEVIYLALFLWLAIAGAGRVSLDHLLERRASA